MANRNDLQVKVKFQKGDAPLSKSEYEVNDSWRQIDSESQLCMQSHIIGELINTQPREKNTHSHKHSQLESRMLIVYSFAQGFLL